MRKNGDAYDFSPSKVQVLILGRFRADSYDYFLCENFQQINKKKSMRVVEHENPLTRKRSVRKRKIPNPYETGELLCFW